MGCQLSYKFSLLLCPHAKCDSFEGDIVRNEHATFGSVRGVACSSVWLKGSNTFEGSLQSQCSVSILASCYDARQYIKDLFTDLYKSSAIESARATYCFWPL